ncbi:MAG: TlpA family protein disulfide reductase [Proteobacteria bacterium]|nr:TlpA family protein disulfide reductase [Pseudomonadota bacterium]
MRDVPAAARAAKSRGWQRRAVTLAGVAALLYGTAGCSNPPGNIKALARGGMAKLAFTEHANPPPATPFTDAAGKAHTIAEFKGKVTVVNIWAKWCAPCVTEIPSLARLQAAYAGKPVAVVTIDMDKGEDIGPAQAFIAKNAPLTYYSEPTYALPYALRPVVQDMPTTIIYDKAGVERARLAGGADWSGDDAKAVIDALLKG